MDKLRSMKNKDFSNLTDQELLVEKKKLKNSKITDAIFIGFVAGILLFGVVAWILSPEKKIGFFIPMLIPIFFIYKLIKKPKKKNELEEVLKDLISIKIS